ncbi:glycosyltransferase family 69 protein [Diplodia corticola]|uniref:Glycosyltransferase family 69 protein n=1 Tax=Diplodia corticola TaxID=236234 RepID=A0A1J9RU20_9PEZI|nr:glycosyltransferase family 69 protein [Diplodia corticola]OJD36067.1 glycosyltransferase family 69 protein [Diplodia corticola]
MPFNMSRPRARAPRYEPLRPSSSSSEDSERSFPENYCDTPKSEDLDDIAERTSRWVPLRYMPAIRGGAVHEAYHYRSMARLRRPRRTILRCVLWSLVLLPYLVCVLVVTTMVLRPSYTHAPAHYDQLRERATQSLAPGRGNVNNEKVFIASSIYDDEGMLAGGAWGKAVLDLVDLLGPENVYLSIYENDPEPAAKHALEQFKERVTCNSSIVSEHLPLDDVRRVTVPNGERRIKRIAYLAEVRNRALRPLQSAEVTFDKVLFLNDVYFDPVDAAQLLFSTNVDENGRTDYRAACAVDFINPFKFYDTFASRDLEGHSMGIPFFPWFASAGYDATRNDVIGQKDAVRVRSCWGGMISYEAKWFQSTEALASTDPSEGTAWGVATAAGHNDPQVPANSSAIRFRFEDRTYWDASECCLVNADIQKPREPGDPYSASGIYLNPYIRTAYDERTLSWLWLTRRPERLYSPIHNILNWFVGFPGFNPRRLLEPGQEITEKVWEYNSPYEEGKDMTGQWKEVQTIAPPGFFCGSRKLLVLGEKEDEPKWMNLPAPLDTIV